MVDLNRVRGIIPPVFTPIDENERVDESAFRRLLRHCVDVGLHGVFAAGTNGEAMALRNEERERVISIALDEVGKDVPVLCGAIDASTGKVIDHIKAIEQMGGELVVITPPFYMKAATDAEILRHFELVADSTPLKIFLYNIPGVTGSVISNDVVFEAAKIDNIVGYKDSSGNMAAFLKALQHFKGTGFKMFMGITDLAPAALLFGADGFIPGLGPIFYELYLKMFNAAISGDLARVKELYGLILPSNQVAPFGKNGIATNKFIASLTGIFDGTPVAPSIGPNDEAKEALKVFAAHIIERARAI